MKTSIKIFIKLCLFTYFLFLTPFFNALPNQFGFKQLFFKSNVYESELHQVSIKERLSMMKIEKGVLLNDENTNAISIQSGEYVNNSNKEETKENQTTISNVDGKKVYIYNTHQQEGYQDNKTVMDASIELANQLQNAGVQVVYETNDFTNYLKSKGLDYNSSYQASYYYLNEAFVKYGGFDLVIDFHRDSIPRESTYVTINNKSYAKMMFVIGALSKNFEHVNLLSLELTNIIESIQPGVIKQPMQREAYYNQQVYENSVLIEVGSDNNTYEEVKNSTNLLGEAIIQYLG